MKKSYPNTRINKELRDTVKSNPNFLWTFAVVNHPPFELYIAPFIIGSKYLSKIFLESLSTANKIDSSPDCEKDNMGNKMKVKKKDLFVTKKVKQNPVK